jgi:hypothetical protein
VVRRRRNRIQQPRCGIKVFSLLRRRRNRIQQPCCGVSFIKAFSLLRRRRNRVQETRRGVFIIAAKAEIHSNFLIERFIRHAPPDPGGRIGVLDISARVDPRQDVGRTATSDGRAIRRTSDPDEAVGALLVTVPEKVCDGEFASVIFH